MGRHTLISRQAATRWQKTLHFSMAGMSYSYILSCIFFCFWCISDDENDRNERAPLMRSIFPKNLIVHEIHKRFALEIHLAIIYRRMGRAARRAPCSIYGMISRADTVGGCMKAGKGERVCWSGWRSEMKYVEWLK